MRDDLRAHLAYMAVDMPASERMALGLDDDRTAQLRQIVNAHGPSAAGAMIPDDVLDRYAIVGEPASVTARLAALCQQVQPELLVFDAADYSVEFLASVAALASNVRAAVTQDAEVLHGLDSHD